jgi:hypothetical protein
MPKKKRKTKRASHNMKGKPIGADYDVKGAYPRYRAKNGYHLSEYMKIENARTRKKYDSERDQELRGH